jgi:hypothetical protein
MTRTTVVAIHQPNFLPWMGYFHKMMLSDVFILLDTVPYTKNGYQNRVKIKTAQGARWLTIPVLTKGRFGQLTSEVEIKDNIGWRKTHLLTLTTNYARAPYFADTMAWLRTAYDSTTTRLAQFNQTLIEIVRKELRIETPLVLASTLNAGGSSSQHLLELVQKVGGTTYLSGPSGRHYLDEAPFLEAGVKIQYQQFQHPVYPQLHGDFVRGLSIIDLLMNVGPIQARHVLESASESNQANQDDRVTLHR